MCADPIQMHLKTNLKALLKKRGMSVAHLSRKTGVPVQTIHNWLLGLEPKRLTQVKSIANELNISLEDLCFTDELRINASPFIRID